MGIMNAQNMEAKIAKGWRPHKYLTNMSMAYFMAAEDAVAPALFPICPVATSTGFYYEFSRADLARNNVRRKPAFGKVQPAIIGQSENSYHCYVDQVILGIDQIGRLNYVRAGVPGVADPRAAKIRTATEQMTINLDAQFAQKFFRPGVWTNEWTGVDGATTGKQFIKFDNDNSDPILMLNGLSTGMKRTGRRRPNKLALGANVFDALQNHPAILDRIKFTGTSVNPAMVTEQALAALFRVKEVKVLESTYNAARLGEDEDMQFICSPNDALLVYAPDAPQIDEPSAGYTFTWDMLGDGNYMAMDQWDGEPGTHAEFVEGLMSTDMKKTSDDLAVYMKDCVTGR
jgi:hypothetical protein